MNELEMGAVQEDKFFTYHNFTFEIEAVANAVILKSKWKLNDGTPGRNYLAFKDMKSAIKYVTYITQKAMPIDKFTREE